MSFITDFKEINRSCLNNSSSKQLFTIPKQQRFKRNLQTQLTSKSDFLDSPNSFTKSKAQSFTKSKRQLIFQYQEQLILNPPPNKYNSSVYTQNKPGITIAKKLNSHYQSTQHIGPGPGKYKTKSFDRLNKSIGFTKQKRQFKYPLQNRKGQDTPGPNLIESQKLKSILSKYKNARKIKMPKKNNLLDLKAIKQKIAAQQREQKLKQKIGKQSEKNIKLESIKTIKDSFSNKNKSKIGFAFGHSPRKSFFDPKNNNPSPANYGFFSQFAHRNKPDTVDVINTPNSRGSNRSKLKTEVQSKKGRTVSALS